MTASRNFTGFIWHAFWLALAETFAEKNVVLPALILFIGGTQTQVGILTSLMIGVPLLSQLLFAGYLTGKPRKKYFLLGGIYLRVFAFLGVGLSIFFFDLFTPGSFILIIFFWMTIFSISGAFATVSYTDIVGKSFDYKERKKFFVTRQFISSIGILISAVSVDQILTRIKYPYNYQTAFFAASVLLFIGAGGFWFLKEKPSEILNKYKNIKEIVRKIPHELKSNSNLKYFVIASNLIGFTYVLIPFYIGFIKSGLTITPNMIGNFLIVQITGMILSNFVWHKAVKKLSFKGMLRISATMLSIVPIAALILALFNNVYFFYILFLLTGSAISAQKIAQEGVLVEISNEINRPLYIGIFGTLNFSSAIFPILLGLIIHSTGYKIVFPALSVITLSALYFINKMICPVDLEKI